MTPIQQATERIVELARGLDEDRDLPHLGALRPEVEKIVSTAFLAGAAWGEEVTIERLRELYAADPSRVLRIVEGEDPSHLAQEIESRLRGPRPPHPADRR